MNLIEEYPDNGSFVEGAPPDNGDDQRVLPRVGEKYQIDIPPIVKPYVSNSNSEMILPVPVMSNHYNADKTKIDLSKGALNSNGFVARPQIDSQASDTDPRLKPEPLDMSSPLFHKSTLGQQYTGKGAYFLPGVISTSWTEAEDKIFLLGLYIFGKNLAQLKKFVEIKGMGDILSHYYGDFYKSEGYRRWSECKKKKTKRFIHGDRIFTGWRQQELLSRLLPNLPGESKMSLLEVSKTFEQGKILLEEYVSALKAAVGISVLVEAVSIGKGKQDLTGFVAEPAKIVQHIPPSLKVPVGKACSSLAPEDIIKFLKGDVRLSKARSNDIFWEAVWPRLLARGWRSEQPKNYKCTSSKQSLVFLVCGVKKFSRKLDKGIQYFDSITDVLNKVASEPGLIELENEDVKVTGDNGLCMDTNFDKDTETSEDPHHKYLRPRLSKQISNRMKFTVVDTSLEQKNGRNIVRTLRSLPGEDSSDTSVSTSLSSGTDESSEDPMDELDTPNKVLDNEVNTVASSPSKSNSEAIIPPGCTVSVSEREVPVNGPHITAVPMDNDKDHHGSGIWSHNRTKAIKCQFKRKADPGLSNDSFPSQKRRRLAAYSGNVLSDTTNYISVDANGNVFPEVDTSHNLLLCGSPSKGSPEEKLEENNQGCPEDKIQDTYEGVIIETHQGNPNDTVEETPHLRNLIDLNLPHQLDENDAYESVTAEIEVGQSSLPKDSQQPLAEDFKIDRDGSTENQPAFTERRLGTRNRPLTAKALEAFASDIYTPKPKPRRRATGTVPLDTSTENPVRRRRGRPPANALTNINVKTEDRVKEESNSNNNAGTKANDCTEQVL